jgi:hypothetical protein
MGNESLIIGCDQRGQMGLEYTPSYTGQGLGHSQKRQAQRRIMITFRAVRPIEREKR